MIYRSDPGRTDRSAPALLLAFALTFASCQHTKPTLTPAAASPAGRVRTLQHDLDAILAAPSLDRGYWGVLVKSLRTDETLYTRNARKLMMPASNMKIVTLAAAAERLGWDYTYETTVRATGAIGAGLLDGDLVVVGAGDPSLMDAAAQPLFATWADRLKANGISTISGRIIGDDGTFDDEPLGMGWSWDDLPDGYAAGVGALQFNENMARVTVTAGAAVGDPASVTVTPDATGLVVHNRLTTGAAASEASIRTHRLPGSAHLELRGSMPIGSAPSVQTVSVDNPTLFFVSALRNALIAHGIDVRGPAVDIDDVTDAPSRDDGVRLISYRSPPLSTLAMRLMKASQNQYAETLLRTIGVAAGTPTAEMGAAATKTVLKEWGLAEGGVILRDGSGLSRYNYVTPETLVAILAHIDHDEMLRSPFEASLPVAGKDGSLATRMKGTPAEGNARAKTGSMSNVRALSGYVTTADGEPLVFSILANNFEAAGDVVTKAEDAIVVRLAQFARRNQLGIRN
jgi:D-alanyl-D-alanine carboxypeptidase/D-alanyl-D-alanine-endopeptidase (penicillin-binding protein 4)